MAVSKSPGPDRHDLSLVVTRAQESGHPDADWLPLLAGVVNGTTEAAVLNAWEAWTRA